MKILYNTKKYFVHERSCHQVTSNPLITYPTSRNLWNGSSSIWKTCCDQIFVCQLKVDAKYNVTNAKRSEKLNMLGSKMTIRVNIREYTILLIKYISSKASKNNGKTYEYHYSSFYICIASSEWQKFFNSILGFSYIASFFVMHWDHR